MKQYKLYTSQDDVMRFVNDHAQIGWTLHSISLIPAVHPRPYYPYIYTAIIEREQ